MNLERGPFKLRRIKAKRFRWEVRSCLPLKDNTLLVVTGMALFIVTSDKETTGSVFQVLEEKPIQCDSFVPIPIFGQNPMEKNFVLCKAGPNLLILNVSEKKVNKVYELSQLGVREVFYHPKNRKLWVCYSGGKISIFNVDFN